jgi:hypothetical protein
MGPGVKNLPNQASRILMELCYYIGLQLRAIAGISTEYLAVINHNLGQRFTVLMIIEAKPTTEGGFLLLVRLPYIKASQPTLSHCKCEMACLQMFIDTAMYLIGFLTDLSTGYRDLFVG